MRYFIDVVNFVDDNLIWIVLLFLAACLVEFFIFLSRRNGGPLDTDGLFMYIVMNLLVTLGLYVVACLIVGMINCLMDQDWRFWYNYTNFLEGIDLDAVLGIVFVVGTIIFACIYDIDSLLLRIVAAAISAIIAYFALLLAGFIVYVVVAIIIVLIKVVWFVVSGFFVSIFQFLVKYWAMNLIALSAPGIAYGATYAFTNYIRSFKNEISHK